jgi:hypothetical protein
MEGEKEMPLFERLGFHSLKGHSRFLTSGGEAECCLTGSVLQRFNFLFLTKFLGNNSMINTFGC